MLTIADPYLCFMLYEPVTVPSAAADPGSPDGPLIVNGALLLFIDLWRDAGRRARTAVNVASLPANALLETETVVELK